VARPSYWRPSAGGISRPTRATSVRNVR
jgi:hypothetical protein